MPDVVTDSVPHCMTSKLLDYRRISKKSQALPAALPASPPSSPSMASIRADKHVEQVTAIQARYTGPLDYPTISRWLLSCSTDLERGRDNHPYTSLSEVFEDNGCTRIDDVARLSGDAIKAMAEAKGVCVNIGLINRICAYAIEDVATVQRTGRLSLS